MSILVKDNNNINKEGIIFKNSDFESEGSKYYIPYKGTASIYPLNETYTNPLYTSIKSSSSTPLVGSNSGIITKTSGNGQGEGIYIDFSIDEGLRSQALQLSFIYKTIDYSDNDVGVYIYDKDTNTIIYCSIINLPSSPNSASTFLATFIPNYTSSNYRIYFHIQSTLTTAWQIKIDNVKINKENIAVGAAISEWRSYNPTWSYTPQTSNKAVWRRNGDCLELKLFAQWNAAGSGTTVLTFTIPSGLTIDLAKLPRGISQTIGNGYFYRPDIGVATSTFSAESSTTISVFNNGTPTTIKHADITSGAQVSLSISTIPIAQWTSNVNLASDFTEYAYNYSTTTTSDSTSFAYGSEGAAFQAFAPTGIGAVTKLVKFRRPIQPTDIITLEAFIGEKWSSFYNNSQFIGNFATNDAGTIYYGASINPVTGDPSTIGVLFYSGPYVGFTSWSSLASAGYRWRVRKVSNGNMAEEAPQLYINKYTTPELAYKGAGIIAQGTKSGWDYVVYGNGYCKQSTHDTGSASVSAASMYWYTSEQTYLIPFSSAPLTYGAIGDNYGVASMASVSTTAMSTRVGRITQGTCGIEMWVEGIVSLDTLSTYIS